MTESVDPRTHLFVYCRGGFEREALLECTAAARKADLETAQGTSAAGAAHVLLPAAAGMLLERLPFRHLVFARHMAAVDGEGADLTRGDRLTALRQRLAAIVPWTGPFADLWLGWPDADAARVLAPLCRSLEGRLRQALLEDGLLLPDGGGPRAEVILLSGLQARVGTSLPRNGAQWPMGIPRLALPAGSPSRSALKLEEALVLFCPPGRNGCQPRAGQTVVDLGAAPGGWTLAMARRGLTVTAVDRGALTGPAAMAPGVRHVPDNGFHFRPKVPVTWLLCDMLDKPARVAELVARWGVNGWCRRAIFNLKLPMKRRFEAVEQCREHLASALGHQGRPFRLRFRQLYHDREEVTGFLELDVG
ncbi:MAG: 23S rRNA (cytidine(2498)-2'-O)-methyltransferase RlmM [Magnetococcales bacterium]|nr:23S rRNA (cytidine(2498)-2'-O)-methyltransferase RlmM [Magnetococcales bacterium]